jgi:hypothetical protein
MDLTTVQGDVRTALRKLHDEEQLLFEIDSSERSITHWLGVYLIGHFPAPYKVDCEYNRRGERESKNIKELAQRLREMGGANPDLEEKVYGTVFPDVIVHERTEQNNLLIIETKKSENALSHDYDFEKLKIYTTNFAESPKNLHYTHGLFLEFVTGKKSMTLRDLCKTVIWFSKGTQLKKESVDFHASL